MARINGSARLRKLLRDLPDDMQEDVRQAVALSADWILQDALRAAPVDSGFLKDSLRVALSKDKLVARVGSFGGKTQRAFYAALVEFGTAAGSRKARAGGTQEHPGTKPGQPYLLPAYEKNRQRAFKNMENAVKHALSLAAKSGGGPL